MEFHLFVQSAFYALAQGLAMLSVYPWLAWAVALGVGVVSGALGRRIALGYEEALRTGAPVDVSMCLTALRASLSGRGWGGWDMTGAVLMLGITGLCLHVQGATGGLASGLACAALFCLACIDMRTGLLPDAWTLPLLGLGVWIGPGYAWEAMLAATLTYLGARVLAGLYSHLRGQVGMGGGDFKLMAALAAWAGGEALVWIILCACLGGVLFAMSAQRRLVPRGAYPLGPFIALAAAPVLVAGVGVQSWL